MEVFATTADRMAYLTNPARFAGQVVTDLETEQAYMLNAAGNAWIPLSEAFFPANTGGVMVQVDNSTPVDNIFVFTEGAHTFRWVSNRKGHYPLSQAIILAGDASDKTAVLQAVFNHPDIETVVFDAQQIVTVSGTLNCNGKKIIFNDGGRITGTGTVSDFYFDAGYEQWIFDMSGTLAIVPKGFAGEKFSVKWTGAVTDHAVTDSTRAIQKAIDIVVYNSGLPRTIIFPKGKGEFDHYTISAPIICSKKIGNVYNQCNVNLEGVGDGFANNASMCTQISCRHTDSFAIGFQIGYSCVIRNLYIHGQFKPEYTGYKGFVELTESGYIASSLVSCRNNKYSPYAGIVIDPFPIDGAFPEKKLPEFPNGHPEYAYPGTDAYGQPLAGYYTYDMAQGDFGGSTAILVENLSVDGFIVDYLVSPNGQSGNAEDIVMNRVQAGRCYVGWCYGQAQTRGCKLMNWRAWFEVRTVLDNTTYGHGTGELPACYGGNIAGAVYRIINMNGFQSGVFFKNLYAESLYKIGYINGYQGTNKPSTFDDCQIVLYDSGGADGVAFPDTYGHLGDVTFRGGYIKKMARPSDKIYFNGYQIKFENCEINYLNIQDPVVANVIGLNERTLPDTIRFNTTAFGYQYTPIGNTKIKATYFRDFKEVHSTFEYDVPFSNASQALSVHPDIPLSAPDAENRIIIPLTNSHRAGQWVLPGDYILAYFDPADLNPTDALWSDTVSSAYGSTGNRVQAEAVYGQVLSSSPTQIVVGGVPKNFQSAGNITQMRAVSPLTIGVPFIGDCVEGNPTITNVETLEFSGFPYVGQFVYNPYYRALNGNGAYADYSRVVAADPNAGTVQLSDPTNVGIGRQFITGCPKIIHYAKGLLENDYLYFAGTVKKMLEGGGHGFECEITDPGKVNPTGGQHKLKAKMKSHTFEFTPGDPDLPAVGASTFDLGIFRSANRLMVFRNFIPQKPSNPGGGGSYYTYVNNVITFFPALTATDYIQISVL